MNLVDTQSDSSLENGNQESAFSPNLGPDLIDQNPGGGQNGSSPFRFNKRALLITVVAVALIVAASIGGLLYVNVHSKKHTAGKSNASYAVTSPSTKGLSQSAALLLVNQTDRLNVNGQLRVGNTVVLTPSAIPSSPTPGQFYYSQVTNTPYYYNGGQFVSLAPTVLPQHVTSIGGGSGNITVGSGLAVRGTTISNNGLLGLIGTANQLNISTSNGIDTVSLPQNIDLSASPTFAGLFLTNTSSSNLVNLKALNPSDNSDATVQIPSIAGGSTDTICLLILSNCVGFGSTVSTIGGAQNYITKYNNAGANQLTNSQIYDNGISVAIGNSSPSGLFSVGASSQFQVSGVGAVTASDLAITNGSLSTNSVQRLTNAGALTNISGYTQISGNFDASASGGTFKTSTGLVSLNGNTSIPGVSTLTVGTGATTLGGILGVTGLGTFNSGLTLTGGSTFTNASSSLFSSVVIANHPAGGNIGNAAATVDVATTFDITQTTAGQTLTLPNPTVTTSGRVVYVNALAGNATFTMYGVAMTPSSSASFIWNGSTWVATSTGGTGVNNIGSLNGGTANANGATISGSTLFFQSASTSYAGLVDTATQSFAGAKTFTGASTFENSVDSTNAFQIQNAAGTSNLFVADTTNGRVGIGKAPTSGRALDVNGAIAASSYIQTTAFVLASNGGYLDKYFTVGTNSVSFQDVLVADNFGNAADSVTSRDTKVIGVAINSATSGNTVQVAIAGAVTMYVDTGAVNIDDQLVVSSFTDGSHPNGGFAAVDNGATTGIIGYALSSKAAGSTGTVNVNLRPISGQSAPRFQNATDSTSAFQVQNAAGTSNLLVADTTNNRIGIGASPANGVLTVGTNTTTAAGGIYFGTDTDLYRNAASWLKTDGSLAVAGSMNVTGANMFVSANTVFQNNADSTTAFQVQNAAGTITVLDVDTTNGRVGIGTSSPAYNLSVAGPASLFGNAGLPGVATGLYLGTAVNAQDLQVYRAAASSLGFGRYNGSWLESARFDANGNFGIGTGATVSAMLDVAGNVLFKNGSDSTTAFQIQNAAGTSNLLVADTTNTKLGIAMTPSSGGTTLQVTGNISSTTGIFDPLKFVINSNSATSGRISKQAIAGLGGVSGGDVVVYNSSDQVVDTTTARDSRIYGIATGAAISGAGVEIVIGGNAQVTADTGAVNVGDQLVTSTTSGQVTANNSATTGILGTATTSKSAGSSGLVGVIVNVVAGQYSPTFQNSADSTTAFQIQNAAGSSNLFVADTTNTKLGIGAAPSSGGSILQVTGSISATQGFSTPASFAANTSASGGYFGKGFNVGSTGVNQNDVVVLANDAGNQRVIDSTTARDPRVWGVSTATAASGSTATIAIAGNYQVTADTGAVAIGDQLVVSATSGQVTVNNNATTGILGVALSSKSAGSSGLVSVAIRSVGGVSTPVFQNTTDSTTAFQIQNAAGTSNLLVADTTNGRIGIGTTPNVTLDITSAGATTSTVRVTGSVGSSRNAVYQLFDATGGATRAELALAESVGSYSNNSAVGDIVLRANTGSLRLQAGIAVNSQITLAQGGAVTFQNGSNSTTALLVQNAAGTANVFDVDTASNRVGIGTAALSQSLTINQGSIADQMGNPSGLTPTPSASGGTLATNTYYYKVSSLDGAGGETFGSTEASTAVTGPTGSVALTWTPATGIVSSYRIYRGTSPGGENVYYTSATASFTDTGAANTGGSPTGTPTAYNYKVTNNGNSWFNGGNVGIGTANPAQTLSVLGSASVQSSTNSTTAFQIQNAAGTSNLLVADTTNTRIGIGKAPTQGALDVNGAIYANSEVSTTVNFALNSSSVTSNFITKGGQTGSTINQFDVVIMNSSAQFVDTTTARDSRVYGVSNATYVGSGTFAKVIIAGDYQVNVDTGAVSIGDQLVTSTTSGQATVDNNATAGIIGFATTSKAGGSAGTVGVRVQVQAGQSTPRFQNTADSTTAFQIQNAAGTNNYLTVDTSNNRIGIFGNPSGSGARLQVSAVGIAGLSVNETGASDLLDLMNTGTNVVTVGATGNSIYKNSSDSTTAFQVQNAAGTSNLLVADTTNSRIGINKAPTQGALDVGGDIYTSANVNAANSLIIANTSTAGGMLIKFFTAGGSVTARDVVVYNASGNVVDTTTARSTAIAGIANNTQTVGNTVALDIGGNTTVNVDTGAVAVGDQLVTSTTSGMATADNSATTGIIGTALTSKAGGSTGTVGVAIRIVNGQSTPRFQNTTDSTTAFQIQNAAGTQLIQVDTSTTPNMLSNGGFEVNATGWSVKGSATISRDTSNQYEGNASLLITTTATANDGAFFPVTLAPNTQYTLSFLYKTSTFTGSLLLVPGRQDISGTDVNCGASGMWGAVWVRSSCTFTTGATITSSNIFFKQSDATARSIWIDAVQLQTGAVAGPYQVGQIQLNGVLSSPVSIKPTQGTTRAFAVYGSDNTTSVLAIDNINNRVGINTIGNPQNSLGVNDLTVGDSAAQLAVGTGGTANKGLIVQGVASQSADLFQLQSSTGSLLDNFTAAGALGVGGSAANSVLTVGTNTTTAAGGITFGTDTNLYRSGSNFLKTDGGLQANGTFQTYAAALFHDNANSTTAFQIQNSSGVNLFTADTTTNTVTTGALATFTGGVLVYSGSNSWNAAAAGMYVGMDAGTSRSINAAGTINGSGADYAEWIPWTTTKPSVGSIVTYQGSNYVVSSPQTAAFVGNDGIDETNAIMVTFAGQVPVKVTGAVMSGDILVSNGNGTAKAISPSTAGLIDYLSKIGIAQASSSDAGVKLIEASIGTTAANVDQSSLQAASATFSDLNVSGATTLDNLTVTGTATIANLTVTGATNVGDITVSGHIITGNKSGATTATIQSLGGAGSGSSCSVTGNDTSGQISITFGAGSTVGVAACKINFGSNYTAAPKPVFTMATYNAANNPTPYVNASDVGSFSIGFTTPPPPAGTYLINYFNAQ